MEHDETKERAFHRRQAHRLLAFAEACTDVRTAEVLLEAAHYYLDRLEASPKARASAA